MPSKRLMITAAQIRAARALLGWNRHKLVRESGVAHSTIADYETERTASMLSENMGKLVVAFAKHGVIFIAADKGQGVGVRWRDDTK